MNRFRPPALALAAALVWIVSTACAAVASPAAGTVIRNVATATYVDGSGRAQSTESNAVEVSVAATSGAAFVNANSCATGSTLYPIGPAYTMAFTIANTSNVSDAYRIVAATATNAAIQSVTFALPNSTQPPVSASGTTSPPVAPNHTLDVYVTLATENAVAGTRTVVTLVARTTNASTANGLQTISATGCAMPERAPSIGSPSSARGAPIKLVDGAPSVAAASGAVVTYTIGYMDRGGMPAARVTLTDPVPDGIVAKVGSVTIDGVPAGNAAVLNANTLVVALGTIAPAQGHVVAFQAQLVSDAAGLALPNVATFTAANAPTVSTSAATVIAGAADTVFDGSVGSSAPLSGATVALIPASGSTQPVPLLGLALAANMGMANPLVTPENGAYAFGLATSQLGSGLYLLRVSSSGYGTRSFALKLWADPDGATYDGIVSSLDGEPLAMPGSFALTHASSVKLQNVYGIFGNLPLFKPQNIVISKNVDRAEASGGDRLVYTISVANGGKPLGVTHVVDELPRDVLYARGTARVDGVPGEPAISARGLEWTFPALDSQHTIVFASVVAPGSVEGSTLVNVATATGAQPGMGTTSASASATTNVVGGVLSDRNVVLGRVFVDAVGDGRFRKGDAGVAKVRVFLEDGESVLTDSDGLFSFPAVRPGMHALHLDPESLPGTLETFDVRDCDDPRSAMRLVHGVLDGGLISDVRFAVRKR